MLIHVVQPNETITSIAQQYGVSSQRLMYDNEVYDPTQLVVGQALLVLFPSKIHLVKEGDTLYSIARDFQVSVISLVRNNPYVITQEGLIPGQTIVISYTTPKERLIETGGYVYPNVAYDVLTQTLPYLNTISIFSYGFTMEGNLIPIDDEDIIEISRKYGVDPMLVLTPLDETGSFNNELVSSIIQNQEMQTNLIQQLLQVVQEKKYSGVNVDFEFVKGEDAQGFADFVSNLRQQMNEQGYIVTVALAPKTSADQVGLVYDETQQISFLNYSLIYTNARLEWGYTYGPPMAVAPINKVKEVVDYAVTQIEPPKLHLGMANYGYDWALPFVKGTSRARSIGLREAVQLAYENNAQILFDELGQSPYFNYTRDGVQHVVWFEDVRSILAKLNLVKAKNLAGVGYWQLMTYFRPNWLLVNALFDFQS